MTHHELDLLIGYLVAGMLLGARLMYAIAYEPGHYLEDPLEFFRIWHGGLSFHGALVGIAAAAVLFARRHRVPFWRLADTLALAGTPGLFFGCLGNFINGELYGARHHSAMGDGVSDGPATPPTASLTALRGAIAEGVILFLVLWTLERRLVARGRYRPGILAAVFLLGYGFLRFLRNSLASRTLS